MTTATTVVMPVNIMKWVQENRSQLKPPVGNKYLYDGNDFFVMVIGGPNARNDFHQSNSEEYFYQLQGDIIVRIREGGEIKDVPVREGETFFIPGNVPHSPTRPTGTIGVYAGSEDNVMWKRSNGVLERHGAASVQTGEVFSLPDDAIHSVTNPGEVCTAALHVYGADLSTIKRG